MRASILFVSVYLVSALAVPLSVSTRHPGDLLQSAADDVLKPIGPGTVEPVSKTGAGEIDKTTGVKQRRQGRHTFGARNALFDHVIESLESLNKTAEEGFSSYVKGNPEKRSQEFSHFNGSSYNNSTHESHSPVREVIPALLIDTLTDLPPLPLAPRTEIDANVDAKVKNPKEVEELEDELKTLSNLKLRAELVSDTLASGGEKYGDGEIKPAVEDALKKGDESTGV